MKIVSAAEMREIDRATSERFGIPSLTLMENAGTAVSRFILSHHPDAHRITVICGKGNNGGDGFVAARKLKETGRAVRVLLLCSPEELRGDAAAMFKKLTVPPHVVRAESGLGASDVSEMLDADLLVDAILGTGFKPPVSPLYAVAIRKMNDSSAPVVAVDIPSGADADVTKAEDGGVRARANAIVTFTAPRPAHVLAGLTDGLTMIVPIGSPTEAIVSNLGLELSTPMDFVRLLAPRSREANKGTYGHVLVIGGSLGKAGAAAMAGFSALRVGAGLSTVATPKSVLSTVAGFHPELMTEPLDETEAGTISLRAFASGHVGALMKQKSVLAVGPGISRNAETVEFVRSVISGSETTTVLDADGLNAFEGSAEKLRGTGRTFIITPHPGEMARLTGLTIADMQKNRIDVARNFAREHELIVVLKGHRTLIASPGGEVWVNPTGNPGMATGGTGDVLTGIVAGLIAQYPKEPLLATALGVYLHGAAGDVAAEQMEENSLVASDLIRVLPVAFARMRSNHDPQVRIHA
jgi:NAD(P)H-hydrate epimerase